MNKHAQALGKLGGSRATEAQKAAARRNGCHGGRPRRDEYHRPVCAPPPKARAAKAAKREAAT